MPQQTVATVCPVCNSPGNPRQKVGFLCASCHRDGVTDQDGNGPRLVANDGSVQLTANQTQVPDTGTGLTANSSDKNEKENYVNWLKLVEFALCIMGFILFVFVLWWFGEFKLPKLPSLGNLTNPTNWTFIQCPKCVATDCQSHIAATTTCENSRTALVTSRETLNESLSVCTNTVNDLESRQQSFANDLNLKIFKTAMTRNNGYNDNEMTTQTMCPTQQLPKTPEPLTLKDFTVSDETINSIVTGCSNQMNAVLESQAKQLQESIEELNNINTIFLTPMEKVDSNQDLSWIQLLSQNSGPMHTEETSSAKDIKTYNNLEKGSQTNDFSVECNDKKYNFTLRKESQDAVLMEVARQYVEVNWPSKALSSFWKPATSSGFPGYDILKETRNNLAATVEEARQKWKTLQPDPNVFHKAAPPGKCKWACTIARGAMDFMTDEKYMGFSVFEHATPLASSMIDAHFPGNAWVKPVIQVASPALSGGVWMASEKIATGASHLYETVKVGMGGNSMGGKK